MAYMNQEKKKHLVSRVKPVMAKYGMKATYGVRHHSAIAVRIKSGKLDLLTDEQAKIDANADRVGEYARYDVGDNFQVNEHWAVENAIDPTIKEFYSELIEALKGEGSGYYNRSDIMVDYFDSAYYVDIRVGSHDSPYQLVS